MTIYIVFGIDKPPLFIALKEQCRVCTILYTFLRLFESEATRKDCPAQDLGGFGKFLQQKTPKA
jgi:hypothetical protein